MRLIVLDTNVIVSARIKPNGFPARIIRDVIQDANIQIVVSPSIVAEYRRVTQYSKFAEYDFPPQWLEFLLEGALRFPNGESWPYPLPDPDHACFLSLAKTTGAWLVTGNLNHYPAECREDVKVFTPAEYVAVLDEAP